MSSPMGLVTWRGPFGRRTTILSSASPSEDDDPEDPENPGDKQMKKKRRSTRHERRHSKEANAFATSKIVLNLPEFSQNNLSEFAESFGRFLRMTGQTHATGRVTCALLLQCCRTKYREKQLEQIVTKSATFVDLLIALERQYPSYETNLSIRTEIQNLAILPNNPKSARISELLADCDHWVGRPTRRSYGSDELLFWLVAKIPLDVWDECQTTVECKAGTFTYEDLSVLLLAPALEKRVTSTSTRTALEEATLGTMAVGIKHLDFDKGLPLRLLAT